MRKITLILISLIMATGMAMAQGGPGGDRNADPKTRAENMTERMVKELSLTDAQKTQVYDLNLEMANKMPKRGEQTDRDKMRAEMEKVRTDYNAKLKQVLTKEQYDIYEKNQSERQGRQGRGNR